MVSIATIETSLRRALLWRFRLGLFDDPGVQPLATLGIEAINTTNAQQLVQEAAAQGLVLLRNDGVLPVRQGLRVAVVGSHAEGTRSLLSDYYGDQVCVRFGGDVWVGVAEHRAWCMLCCLSVYIVNMLAL